MMIHALSELGVQSMADAVEKGGETDRLEHLRHLVDHTAHFLPAQGPITVFIHHNTLHAFEDLTFDQGVQKGAEIFGGHPYLPEEKFREHLENGRIRLVDLQATLSEDLGPRGPEPILLLATRYDLRMAMLQYPKWTAPQAELRWFVAQTDALTKFRREVNPVIRERMLMETRHWVMRDLRKTNGNGNGARPEPLPEWLTNLLTSTGNADLELWTPAQWQSFTLNALWRVIREAVVDLPPAAATKRQDIRPRDRLLEATGRDADLPVNEVLIRFCAAFLDQGISHWPLPSREKGFLKAFTATYGQSYGPPLRWMRDLPRELRRIENLTPLESILESLDALGVTEDHWDDYLVSSLLSLRGWAGMIRQMEIRADRVAHPVPVGSLVEYLAVRLLLERLSAAQIAKEEFGCTLAELDQNLPNREFEDRPTPDQRAFILFQIAQVLGWSPSELWKLTRAEWTRLMSEVEAFPSLERRRVFHAAFERRYRTQALDAFAAQAGRYSAPPPAKPKFQIVCCLDEREESFRRHLEELEPQAETFGIAGFFAVAMYFRGAADAHHVPLCPVVLTPKHWVEEDVVFSQEEKHRTRARVRKTIGNLTHRFHLGSRTGAGGALLAAGIGALATIPLVARVLFPRLTSRIRQSASKIFQVPANTQLQLERTRGEPSQQNLGFTVDEMTNIAERILRDIGMLERFADIVILLGHGSNSVNNPHKSAYDCGACGGNVGGPNARAAAQILNDVRVRINLSGRGITIPTATHFVGAWHNTCNDSVSYFDLDDMPKAHLEDFNHAREILERTCDRNAHERARRFQSAPLTMPFAAARRHVEARAEDLAQTRPECGHATNAICFVGRRERTRGLFLDRRTFLTSYDPTHDPDAAILTRTMQAAVPVCGGINLEYYFSYVDNVGWGCGTKLPHNVTALLGVMDGAASDLRPGLPWQMVEIHEPVRLLFVVETSPEVILSIMSKNPGIDKMVRNGWVQMAVLDPHSPAIQVYQGGKFVAYDPENLKLPRVSSSVDWYRGWRDHLGFAMLKN